MSCRRLLALSVGVLSVAATAPLAGPRQDTGWAWLAPDVVLTARERQRLDADEIVIRSLPAPNAQLGTFAASRIKAPPEALVWWGREIEQLKRSPAVAAAGRISLTGDASQLANLELDDADLDDIRSCRPGNCRLKLTTSEIARLRVALEPPDDRWRARVQQAFREVVIARVRAYMAGGLQAIPPVANGTAAVRLSTIFDAILAGSPFLGRNADLSAWLRTATASPAPFETLIYWSKERYGPGKAVVTVTHVAIMGDCAGAPASTVVVLSKQIMATRYLNGALAVSAMVPNESGGSYLVYLNRSSPDLLHGLFGRMIRGAVEDQVRREAPEFVRLARSRIESGRPPSSTTLPADRCAPAPAPAS